MAIEIGAWLVFISALFGYLCGLFSTLIAQRNEHVRFTKSLEQQRFLLYQDKMLDRKIEMGHNILKELAYIINEGEDFLYRLETGVQIEERLLQYAKEGKTPPIDLINELASLIDTISDADIPFSEIRQRCKNNPDGERQFYSDYLSKSMKKMRDNVKKNRLLVHGWSLFLHSEDPSIREDYDRLFRKISRIPNIHIGDEEIHYLKATKQQRLQWKIEMSNDSFQLSNKIRNAIHNSVMQ